MATTASTMPSSAHHAAAARQLAPAGTGAPYGSKNETYESASAEIKAIVRQLNMWVSLSRAGRAAWGVGVHATS